MSDRDVELMASSDINLKFTDECCFLEGLLFYTGFGRAGFESDSWREG